MSRLGRDYLLRSPRRTEDKVSRLKVVEYISPDLEKGDTGLRSFIGVKSSVYSTSGSKSDDRLGWADLLVVPFAVVLSIPSLVWFANNWTVVGNDASRYMLASMYLFSGRDFVTLAGNHGPVLPALIGFLTLLFGRGTDTLAWAVRLLALLNPILAYFLVKKLSSPLAGLISAALISLLGYNITTSSAFNIDGVLLTAYLLALLALMAAVRRDSPSLAFLSGLLLGVSILTKETALANVPLALLAVLLLDWRLRGAVLHYLGLALVCLPWWAWVYSFDGKIYLLGNLPPKLQLPSLVAVLILIGIAGGAYASGTVTRLLEHERLRLWTGRLVVVGWTISLSGLLLSSGSHALSKLSFGDLFQYISRLLYPAGIIVPVLLLIAGYVIWRSWGWDASWRLLALALLFQAPVVLLVAVEGWAWRQFLVPQTLLFCALAALVVDAVRVAARGRNYSTRLVTTVVAAALTALLLVAAGGQVRYLLPGKTETAAAEHRVAPEASRMIDWMARNVPNGKDILVSSAQANYVVFLDGGRHDWTQLKLDQSICVPRPNVQMRCDVNQNDISKIPRDAVWVQVFNDCKVISLSMSNLLEQSRTRSGYVLITSSHVFPRIVVLPQRLEKSGAFKIVHSERIQKGPYRNTDGLVLLKSTGRSPKPVPTMMNKNSLHSLKSCEREKGPGTKKRLDARFPNGIRTR